MASNVLTHGTGSLHIAASRIGTGGGCKHAEDTMYGTGGVYGVGVAAKSEALPVPGLGRWPTNVILGHLDGCVQEGTRTVRGHGDGKPRTAIRRSGVHSEAGGHQTIGSVMPVTSYANADGTETMAAWSCAPGCPVADLDAQSGESKSSGFGGRVVVKRRTGAEREGNTTPRFGAESRPDGAVMSAYDDAGGASRFFKQVGGQK